MGKRTKKGIPFSRFFDYSTEKALCKLTKEDGAVILRPCRRAPERVLRGLRFFLRVWRNGRRARFRFWCLRRAGSSPVTRTIITHTRGFTYVSEQHSSGKVAAFFRPHRKAAPPAAPARGRPVRRAAEARSGDRLRSIMRGLRPQPTGPC